MPSEKLNTAAQTSENAERFCVFLGDMWPQGAKTGEQSGGGAERAASLGKSLGKSRGSQREKEKVIVWCLFCLHSGVGTLLSSFLSEVAL